MDLNSSGEEKKANLKKNLLNPKWASSSKENSDEDEDWEGFVKDNFIVSINNEQEKS